ncbi:unnamed protein product [Didymodactylos carnosus]|uniref:Protein SMG9 n=1 Tax=Didymodactylos carnosus TaxID=1234261 RepID=A0A814XID5_9BILA|nr:unnamed protein product [Didymodactylos carnosus]CAF1216167.1 unnamed protein product [Didymodactylos carnosus]CAF3649766.1 unnamed protein product [Didymodactylos carnosus]CAF3979944.1 unnamed protein product [Didymodactylos carnosus]
MNNSRKENGFISKNKKKEDSSPLGYDGNVGKQSQQEKWKILKRGDHLKSADCPSQQDGSQSKENINNKLSNVGKQQQHISCSSQKNLTNDERLAADGLKLPSALLSALSAEKTVQTTQPIIINSNRQQSLHLALPKQSASASPPVRPSPSTTPTVVTSTPTSAGTVTPQGNLPSISSYFNILNPSVPLVLTKASNIVLPSTSVSSTAALHEQYIQSVSSRLFGSQNSSIMMKSSMKLIDDTLGWCENGQIQQYLHDTEGNLVIGALGRQHVGKSTLLSLLGGNQFTDEDRTMIFPPSSQLPTSMSSSQMTSSITSTSTQSSTANATSKQLNSVTTGIDLYVTSERTILLDTQPLLSPSLLQNLIENEQNREQQHHQRRHYNHHYREQNERQQDFQHLWQQQNDPNSIYIDNMIELKSIEIACFIMSVCHVVLIIEDQFADPYIYRLLQLAEILRPVIKTNQRELIRQHSPHLIFVMNKCDDYIQPHEHLTIKKTINNLMCETRFFYRGSLNNLNKLKIRTSAKSIILSMTKNMSNNNHRMMKMNGGTNENESGDKGGLKKLFQNKNKSTTKTKKMLTANDLRGEDDTKTEKMENESEDDDDDDQDTINDYKLREDDFEDENDVQDDMDNESEEGNKYTKKSLKTHYLNSYDNVNAVFIPRRDFRVSSLSHWQSRFIGFSNPDSTIRQLRQQLLSIDRPLIDQCLSQRAWLNHASRVWDSITRSNWIADYSRLMT